MTTAIYTDGSATAMLLQNHLSLFIALTMNATFTPVSRKIMTPYYCP